MRKLKKNRVGSSTGSRYGCERAAGSFPKRISATGWDQFLDLVDVTNMPVLSHIADKPVWAFVYQTFTMFRHIANVFAVLQTQIACIQCKRS